jgi:iron complex transport system ATP-binding protein
MWHPSSGNVFWKEENLHAKERLEISKIISFVPQNVQTHFDFSVFELVAMGRYPYGQESLEPLKEAMYAVDVWHLREQNISTLSAGEKQRVYIARALATAAPVLLLDEPTANLDIRHQLEIWSLLKKLVTEGKIVIVTTHDLAATEEYCDSVVILNEGRYVTKGPYAISVDEQLLRDVFGIKKVNTPLPLKFREFP